MAWIRPTLPEVIARVENDFSVKFFGTAAPLRRAVLKIMARVWAGAVYLLHLYQAWRYDQGFVHLADADQLPRHGQEVGIYQKAPGYAEGLVYFTGNPAMATLIPQGTLIQNPTTRQEYQTTADGTMDGSGRVRIRVTAVVEGVAGNCADQTRLELVSPIDEIGDEATTAEALIGGSGLEAPEPYRARIWFKKRKPPQGGADPDYIEWATSVAPVTDAWVFAQFPEANSVSVRVANYNAEPPVLAGGDVSKVLAYLTDRKRKPVTADVRVLSVVVSPITVAAAFRPFTASTRAAAEAVLRDLFSAHGEGEGEPGAPGTTIAASQIQDAISGATGVLACTLGAMTQDAVTVTSVSLTMNQVPTLGAVTFTALP